MSAAVLKVAVVGHTNTGKTSLLRTLTRDSSFGEVSNRPSTTRHVEATALLVGDAALIELYDTPGLEDSIGLLEYLEELRGGARVDGIELIERFLSDPGAHPRFEQEAKVLRQLLDSDVALYVIDARDRVLGKHRDELDILGKCAKPVIPVLNFIASPEARTGQWREHLARVNLHAVVEFDTVVLDEYGEQRLYEKMQTLLDRHRGTLAALIEDRIRLRARLNRASADLLADLLIDAAAYRVIVPPAGSARIEQTLERLKQAVREREQSCVDRLLELFRFRLDDYAADMLPIDDGRWGLDLFNPESLRQFGIRVGSGAAVGGAAGLAVDIMTGGLTLGAAAALGAAFGALWRTSKDYGKRLADRFRGFTELRVSDATLRLLAVRQIHLVKALLRRGHASQQRIRLDTRSPGEERDWLAEQLPSMLERARANPHWSHLNASNPDSVASDTDRLAALEDLARLIERAFSEPAAP